MEEQKTLIRNVVFDMGMVLLDYDPLLPCLRHAAGDEALANRLCDAIFRHPEWGQYIDGGLADDMSYLPRAEQRLSDPAERALAKEILQDWYLDALFPNLRMRPVIQQLLEEGYHLYLLSNVGYSFQQFRYKMPFLNRFDGILLSCEEKLLKPDTAIYNRLCQKFGLKAEECLFVDDLQRNIDGAEAAGLHGHCFADGDIQSLLAHLQSLNP